MLATKTKALNLLIALLAFTQIISAQQNEVLNATFAMSSNDGKISSKVCFLLEPDQPSSGYFIIPSVGISIYGKIGGGGFDFMDYETAGTEADFVVPLWIKNDFFLEDLEGFSQGPDVKSAVSFQIKPFYSDDKKSNKKAYLVKFAVLFPKRKTQYSAYDQDCDVKLFYKLLHPDSTGSLRVDYLKKILPDYNFVLKVKPLNKSDQTIEVNPLVYREIKKSLADSKIVNNSFAFSVELGIYWPKELGWFKNLCLSDHEQNGLIKKYNIVSDFSTDTTRIEHPIYCADLKFPFKLYNEQKEKQYNSYKTKNDVLVSDYKVIVIPISYNEGKLTIDAIVNYSKLDLKDGIQRWSPFKKRLVIEHGMENLDMPQENWSAVLTSNKEKYEIYGYSDYEKYISEILFVKLNKVF